MRVVSILAGLAAAGMLAHAPAAVAAEENVATETVVLTAATPAWTRLSRKELIKLIEKKDREITRLETEQQVAAEGFQYVTLEWIKAALLYRGYYQVDASAPEADDLVFSYLGDRTVRASQRFQCDFKYDGATCDPRSQTGWLTYIEARDLICRGAYEFIRPNTLFSKADPDLTLLVADWYMRGRVYEQSPRIAYFLLKHLLENITYRFEREQDPDERKRLAGFQRQAIDMMDLIVATPKVSIKDLPNYTVGDVCPRTL